MTRTFVELEVSQAAFDEIAGKLRAAGYAHACGDGIVDMHGIALTREPDALVVCVGPYSSAMWPVHRVGPCEIPT